MKSYRQYCALARSLDLLGDRWTLLIIRELLLGDRRFTDLVDGLPGIPRNLLSSRLAAMRDQGLVEQVELGPPLAVTLYRLTEEGHRLEEAVLALTRWGTTHLGPAGDEVRRGAWLGLLIAAWTQSQDEPPVLGDLEIRLPEDTFHLQCHRNGIRSRYGPGTDPWASVTLAWPALLQFLSKAMPPHQLPQGQDIEIEGDRSSVERFLSWLEIPDDALPAV